MKTPSAARHPASLISALLLSTAASGVAMAGSVITANLPTGSAIINVDARADGAAGYDDNFATWTKPFSNDISYTFAPGTYTFSTVNPTDAAAAVPTLTTDQLANIYTAWTYNSPWLTDWMAFKTTALTDGTEHQLFFGAVGDSPATIFDANTAYSYTKAAGELNKIRLPGRTMTINGTVELNSYTFDTTTTLLFAIPDQGVYDNTGGVSILIQPLSVPEPGSIAAVATAGLLAIGRRRR